MKLLLLALVLALVLSSGCAVCTFKQTRCQNQVVEACGSNGQWQRVMNCADVTPGPWSCALKNTTHTCVRP